MSVPAKKYTFKFFCQHCDEVHQPVFDTWEEAEAKWKELAPQVQSIQPSIEVFIAGEVPR